MDIIPARGLAEDDFFGGGVEFHEADGAVAGDWFAVGWFIICVVGGRRGRGKSRGMGEDLLEFGG